MPRGDRLLSILCLALCHARSITAATATLAEPTHEPSEVLTIAHAAIDPASATAAELKMSMRAVAAAGGKCSLVMRQIPVPVNRDLLLRVHWTAINRADTLQRKGAYPPPPGVTDILGLEASGEVVGHGPGCTLVHQLPVGTKVMALLSGGGNAEYVTVHESHVMPVPGSLDLRTAAAIPETWLTAFQLLFLVGGLAPKSRDGAAPTVLIHAAGSGVGTAAVQLATHAGAHVIAVAGDDDKLRVAQSLGASAGINYKTSPEFAAEVQRLTSGRGVDLILDPVGASFWKQNIEALAPDGTWVLFGSMGGVHVDGSILASVLRKRATLRGTTLRNRSDEYKAALVSRFTAEALPLLSSGAFKPVIDKEFTLAELGAAHEYMESNASTGKIVIRVME